MSGSYTYSETQTFTVTNAKHIASKVAADLKRIQRLYNGKPSDTQISEYQEELIEMLPKGYIDTVTYGFRRNGNWVLALKYHATESGDMITGDDPGKIRPGIDISGASFYSFLSYSSNWFNLMDIERDVVSRRLPFSRTSAETPGIENGYWEEDHTYSSGGRSLQRATIKRY